MKKRQHKYEADGQAEDLGCIFWYPNYSNTLIAWNYVAIAKANSKYQVHQVDTHLEALTEGFWDSQISPTSILYSNLLLQTVVFYDAVQRTLLFSQCRPHKLSIDPFIFFESYK